MIANKAPQQFSWVLWATDFQNDDLLTYRV